MAPEGHPAIVPRPKYRPQRLTAPANGRSQFLAATTGVCTAFAVGGLFAGLAGTFLAGLLHQPSPALTGLTIFLTFGAGVLVQTTTTSWPVCRLLAAGIVPMIGLRLLVLSAWTSPPSLALFLAGGIVAGTGIGAIIRGSLTVVISTASPDDRAGARDVLHRRLRRRVGARRRGRDHTAAPQPRVTLLIFAVAVGLVILAAAPILIRPQKAAAPRAARRDQLAGRTQTTLADTAHATCMDELCTAHGMPTSTPMNCGRRLTERNAESDDFSNGRGRPRMAALVTGGTGGMGRVIAAQSGRRRVRRRGGYAGSLDLADATVKEIAGLGRRGAAFAADIADEQAVSAVFDAVEERFGHLDVVVHTAGINRPAALTDLDLADFDEIHRVNVRGTFVVDQQAARRVRAGGSIVNVSTSMVRVAPPALSAYAASKAAVDVLTRILAKELRGRDVTVNAVAPGPTATAAFLHSTPAEEQEQLAACRRSAVSAVPTTSPASCRSWSGRGRWVNGQVVYANGGLA